MLAALGLWELCCATAAACTLPSGTADLRSDMIRAANAQRQTAGPVALAPDAALTRAAQAHACDMAATRRMRHGGSDGSDMATRIRRAGYRSALASENLGRGFPAPGPLVAAWMDSSGHRAYILAAQTRDVGLGMALSDDGTAFWAMVSGRSR